MTTILITRPQEQGRKTAERLAAKGFEAIVTPALAISPVEAALPASKFDGIMLTSAQALPWLAAQREIDRALPLFAVGERTADAARASGFTDVRAASGDRVALEALVRGALQPGARLLAPVGRDHHADVPEGLRSDGYAVETPVVYAAPFTEALTDEALAALRYDVADAVLHYSPRSAAGFITLLGKAGIDPAGLRLRHICLSQAVADALPASLKAKAIIAAQPDEDSLIEAVSANFHSGGTSDGRTGPVRGRKARTRAFAIDAKAVEAMPVSQGSEQAAATNQMDSAPVLVPPPIAESKPVSVPRVASPAAVPADPMPAGAFSGRDDGPAVDTPETPRPVSAQGPAMARHENRHAESAGANPQPVPSRRRVWPVALAAGLAGGVLGGAAVLFAAPYLPAGWFPAKKEPDVAALVRAQLDARLAALPAKSDVEAAQKAVAAEAHQRAQAIAGVQSALADLSRRVADAAQLARNAPDQVAAAQRALGELTKRVDLLDGVAKVPYDIVGLSKRVDDIAARKPEAPPDLAPLDKQLAAALASIADLRGQIEALAAKPPPDTGRPVRLHALATGIASALQRGAPYKTELDAAAAAGAAPAVIQPLSAFAAQGAPTGPALAKRFEPVATAILAALAPPPPADPGFMERFRLMVTGMVRVRPVGSNGGDTPAGLVARIESALTRGQFAEALNAWQGLPEAGKNAGAAFGAELQARAAAEAAARSLTEETTRALARQGQ